MRAWTRPDIPAIEGHCAPPQLFDSASQAMVEARPDDVARLYVCGITPYDATHIGHATTYLAYDTLQRVWLDGGYRVHYAQNVTDIDDPLLERARDTGRDWRAIADEQIEGFRLDMASLSVIPPDDYVAVTEKIDSIAHAVCILLQRGTAYRVPAPDADGDDIYFDNSAAQRSAPWKLGAESNLDRAEMLDLFAARGGDPDRAGKRDPLDPLLWRATRDGEPTWPSDVGPGRPGWHIECSVIALEHLGRDLTVQGGGSDLIFPHHEMSAGHAAALSGHPLARVYNHVGMVAYQGEKMSKSRGNLVLVSRLRQRGVDPRAIRLAILGQHYRSDWEWTDALLEGASARLSAWETLTHENTGVGQADMPAIDLIREALVNDLDTPGALAVVDRIVAAGTAGSGQLVAAIDALLGIRL